MKIDAYCICRWMLLESRDRGQGVTSVIGAVRTSREQDKRSCREGGGGAHMV
jgi:hypothetical protein